jgi:predicted patatin/cPLA2 family phospholipase
MESSKSHPVIEEIERRSRGEDPRFKLALAIEGGGMRSSVSAGMAAALASSEIDPRLFDAHFGSSGGAYISAYYLSDRTKTGATMFYEDNRGGEFIDLRQILLKRRPALNLDHVLTTVMHERKPIDFERIIDSQRLHVVATRLSDLSRHVFRPPTSVEELKEQLRASATIPAVAGEPVEIDNEYYIDASLSEPMPYNAAIDEGYDAILLLSSRPEDETTPSKGDVLRQLVTFAVMRQIKIKRQEIVDLIATRKEIDAQRLAELRQKTHYPIEEPFVYAIHPPREAAVVKQFEKNWPKIIAGMSAGYLAVKEVFGHPIPGSFHTRGEFKGVY